MPSGFKIVKTIDARTAQFKWDYILAEQAADPNSGMKGRLAGFIVSF